MKTIRKADKRSKNDAIYTFAIMASMSVFFILLFSYALGGFDMLLDAIKGEVVSFINSF